jgi:hypothetical protein
MKIESALPLALLCKPPSKSIFVGCENAVPLFLFLRHEHAQLVM